MDIKGMTVEELVNEIEAISFTHGNSVYDKEQQSVSWITYESCKAELLTRLSDQEAKIEAMGLEKIVFVAKMISFAYFCKRYQLRGKQLMEKGGGEMSPIRHEGGNPIHIMTDTDLNKNVCEKLGICWHEFKSASYNKYGEREVTFCSCEESISGLQSPKKKPLLYRIKEKIKDVYYAYKRRLGL